MSSRLVSCSPVVLSGLLTVSSLVPAKARVRGEMTSVSRWMPRAAAPATARPDAAPRRKRRRFRYWSRGVMRDEGMSSGFRMSMKLTSRGNGVPNDSYRRWDSRKATQHPLDTLGWGDVTGMRGGLRWVKKTREASGVRGPEAGNFDLDAAEVGMIVLADAVGNIDEAAFA